MQVAATAALEGSWDSVENMRQIYKRRRDKVVGTLNSMGWNLTAPNGSIYIWAPVPKGYTSASFAEKVFDESGVVITPGNGYGKAGEGYFRISLTVEEGKLDQALLRLKEAGIAF